ncbi:MAG TPA: hypothetical protein VMH80_03470 [Bryobacteraceae bacterium]|nr:hypothetical protein [Bryobacteraceae bacterium]
MQRNKHSNRVLRAAPFLRDATRGDALADFLNAPAVSKEHGLVVHVFELVRQLQTLDSTSRAASNLLHAINAAVAEVTVRPVRQQNARWDWLPAHPGAAAGIPPPYALKVLADFDEAGTLEHVRQCEACGRWFFARTKKKLVCSDTCRSRKFKQQDTKRYRRARAQYMRDYRKQQRRSKARTGKPSPAL